MRWKYWLVFVFVSLFLSACSDKETEPDLRTILDQLPNEVPSTMEEILNYPTGQYAGKTYRSDMEEMIATVKLNLPRIEDEMDEEDLQDWWQGYHSLFAEKYPDPTSIYKEKTIQPFTHPALKRQQTVYKDQLNVLIILDLSSSMNHQMKGHSMIQIARNAIEDFLTELPDHANVGLRVYGHVGSGKETDKARSCESSDLIYEIQPYDKREFKEALYQYEPKGWTSIAFSLESAIEDFLEFPADDYTNLVYVVSDGIETCDGDPVRAAKLLSDSDIHPIINVIGFGANQEAQKQLEKLAEVGQGLFAKAGNEEELNRAFAEQEEMLRMWEEWKVKTIDSLESHKSNQLEEIAQFYEDWKTVNDRERENIFFIMNELRNDGYITDQAHRFFAEMRSKRTEQYQKLGYDWYLQLTKKVKENYEENSKKVLKELDAS